METPGRNFWAAQLAVDPEHLKLLDILQDVRRA